MNVNDQVRYYAAELCSLVLINNIISSQQNEVKFDSLFAELFSLKKSILDNVKTIYFILYS
jgi:hypothetical protein